MKISTIDWPEAKFADSFRIIKKDEDSYLLEFGKPNKSNNEMTIVSQVVIEAGTLKSLLGALQKIDTMENLEKLGVTK